MTQPTFSFRSDGRARMILALPAALALPLVLAPPARAAPRNVKPGDRIAPLRLNDLDGRAVDTSAWTGGPVVWVFVSPAQASSQRALVDVQAALDGLIGANVRAVAISTDPVNAPLLREFAARANIRIPLLLDPGRDVYGRIGVIVLPTTLLIDRQGRLAEVLSGHDLAFRNNVEARLAHLAGRISADELRRRLASTRPVHDPATDRAARFCRSAELMLQRGLRAEAVRELQQAIEADPTYDAAYLQLARIRLGDGDPAAAEKLIAQVRQRDASNRQALLELGTVRFVQGRLDDAETLLRQALVLNPDPARTHYWLGRVYQAQRKLDRAAEHFRAASERALPDLAHEPTTRPTP